MTTVDRLYNEALELSEEEQEELLARLAEHVESDALRADADWIAEMRRRVARVESGEDGLVPADEVLNRMRQRVRAQRPG